MARKPRRKGPAFDRASGDWNVFQYSLDSENEQRAAKARQYWDQIYKVKSDPAYFVRQLVDRAQQRGDADARASAAKVLGIAKSTLGKALAGKGSTALIERSIKAFNRSEGAHKGARAKKWSSIDITEQRPIAGGGDLKVPKFQFEDYEGRKSWSIDIKGTLTFDGLKRTLVNFAVQAIKHGASMIVATVTVDMRRPGLAPTPHDTPTKDGGWAKAKWYPVRQQGNSIRWATGNEQKGYDPAEFLMNLDDIAADLLRLPGITAINVYAQQ